MPCHRCSARQVDPARGPSAWKRMVRGGEQVLVCPACQREPGWAADADRCPSCGSTALSKSLGLLRCKTCGVVGAAPAGGGTSGAEPGLSDEVTAALNRLFG